MKKIVKKIKRKPPGRPWHKVEGTKVCLVCLRRYEERLLPRIPTDNCNVNAKDPLGDDNDPVRLVEGCSTAIESNCEANDNRDGVYTRFLHILKRQFKMNLKNFRNAAIKNQVEPPFCDQCLDYVENMCNLYNELNKIKLLFYWRLCQISDAIKKSKTNVSYKLSVTLTKSLSTQLFVASSNSVNLLRKRMSLLSSNSSVQTAHKTPKVLINRNSCLLASQAKLQFPLNVMQQFMKSLIVIFTLATPQMKAEKKFRPGDSKSRSKPLGESKKYNADLKIKSEKHRLKIEHVEEHHSQDTAYSPTNSGPASPIGNNDDDDNPVSPTNALENDPDSDWSAHKNSDDSDVEFSINKAALPRRWNLRKRKSDQRMDTERDDAENDPDFSLQLPPLRGARPARRGIDESERKFACNLCGMKFNSERYKRRHLGQAHSFFVQHTCPKCPLKFKKHKDLLLHKKKAHRPDPSLTGGKQLPYKGVTSSCTVCQKVFPSKARMMKHRRTHKVMQMKHTCEICGKVVMGQFRIDFHRKSHERPDKAMRCLKCPRKFYTKEGFDAHSKLHEQNPNWNPYTKSKKSKCQTLKGVPRMGMFKCDIDGCEKAFFKESNLTAHKTLHATSFSCATCEKVFVVPREFRAHLLKHEKPDEKNHFCLHCDKSFTLAQTHEFHLKTNHPSKATLPCDEDYCTEEFANTEALLEHLKTHVGNGHDGQVHEPEVSTKMDGLNSSTDTDGIAAAEDMKLGIYTCDRCKWSFCRKLHLTLHQLIHTPKNDKNMYECSQCDKTYRVVDSLQTHVNTIHGSKIKPYLCKICGVRFHRKESFIPHMKMHTVTFENTSKVEVGDATFSCTKSEETFDNSESLRKHVRNKHRIKVSNNSKCEDCEQVFSTRILLLKHRHKVHGMEKPFKCDHENCDKAFLYQFQLNSHKIDHTEATLQCPMCPRMFRRNGPLNEHISVHKQELNHVCHYCGKAFVKKGSLTLHLAIHRDDKKYKCSHCPKAFNRLFSLNCHIRTHTKEKPYLCKICGTAFGQYPGLKNHLKVHERLNSTIIERRPFKKSRGIGAPIVRKTETEVDSGIIAEALNAAFNSTSTDDGIIDTPIADDDMKEESSESDNKEEEVQVKPVRKSTRKKQQKNLICGFCGKAFAREKPYNAHLERHLTIDAVVEPRRESTDSRNRETIKEDYAQPLLSNDPEPPTVHPEPVFVPSRQTPETCTLVTDPTVVKRKRGRPRKDGMPPGKRLEKIVETVMESATNNHIKIPTLNNMTNASTQISQQRQFPQVTQQQIVQQQPSHIQSPPPMQMAPSPYSERSDSVCSTMSNNPTNPAPTPNPISFISPFLYANPYLLPLGNQQQSSSDYHNSQQNFSTINFNQSRQHVPSSFPQTTSQSSYPQTQIQYHNMPQLQQQPTSSTLPQDLSKHSYSTFYANPR